MNKIQIKRELDRLDACASTCWNDEFQDYYEQLYNLIDSVASKYLNDAEIKEWERIKVEYIPTLTERKDKLWILTLIRCRMYERMEPKKRKNSK